MIDEVPELPKGCTLERPPERDVFVIDSRVVRRNWLVLSILIGFCLVWSAGTLGLTWALFFLAGPGFLTRLVLLVLILLIGWVPAFYIARAIAMARMVEYIEVSGNGVELRQVGWLAPNPIQIERDDLARLTLECVVTAGDPETLLTLNLYTVRSRGLAGRRNILAYHLHHGEKGKLYEALRKAFEARGLELEYRQQSFAEVHS